MDPLGFRVGCLAEQATKPDQTIRLRTSLPNKGHATECARSVASLAGGSGHAKPWDAARLGSTPLVAWVPARCVEIFRGLLTLWWWLFDYQGRARRQRRGERRRWRIDGEQCRELVYITPNHTPTQAPRSPTHTLTHPPTS